MMAAVANKGYALVLAVTVLTLLEEDNTHVIFGGPSKAKVLQLELEAKIAGCNELSVYRRSLNFLENRKNSVAC